MKISKEISPDVVTNTTDSYGNHRKWTNLLLWDSRLIVRVERGEVHEKPPAEVTRVGTGVVWGHTEHIGICETSLHCNSTTWQHLFWRKFYFFAS